MPKVERRVFRFHEINIRRTAHGYKATIFGPPTLKNVRGSGVATTGFSEDSNSAFVEARKQIDKLLSAEGLLKADARLALVVDRVLRLWAQIKLVPQDSLTEARAAVSMKLSQSPDLSEQELVVAGLRVLYRTVQPGSGESPNCESDSSDRFEQIGDALLSI
jgi:hypothetical protein